jgi:hypothetical protein
MSQVLDRFIAAGTWPQRSGMSALVALARRPRGARLLAALAPLDQLAGALLAGDHYENPAVARPLGWDADAVAARGLRLRRAEGRP